MKKTIYTFLFALMFSITIGSCGNGATTTATDVDSTATDSIEIVDSLLIDTVDVDTIVNDTVVAE